MEVENYSFTTVRQEKKRRMAKQNPKFGRSLSLSLCSFLGFQLGHVSQGSLSHLCKGCLKGNHKNPLLSGGFNSLLQVITSPLEA